MPTSAVDAVLPRGEVLVSLLRRGVAAAVDLGMLGLPLFLGAVTMLHGGTRLTPGARITLAVEAAVFTVVYHTVAVAWLGRTIGKALMRCRVVRAGTGASVTWSAAAIRATIIAIATARPDIAVLLLAVVYGSAWFDPAQRGLHDRAAGTIVVLD